VNFLSLKKSAIAEIMMMKIEAMMIEMPSSSPPGPIPIQPKIPEKIAEPPTKSHCFSYATSLTDDKKSTGGSTGFAFFPNTSDLRLRSFSSPMIPVYMI